MILGGEIFALNNETPPPSGVFVSAMLGVTMSKW